MKTSHIIKGLAALLSSGAVITAVQELPDPWGKVVAGVASAVAAYVNWASHKDDTPAEEQQ